MSKTILDFPAFAVKAMGNVVEVRFTNKNSGEKKTITIDDEYIYLDHECESQIENSVYEKCAGVKIKHSEFRQLKNHLNFFKEHLDYATYAPVNTLYMDGYKMYIELEGNKIYDFGGAWSIQRIIKLLLDEYDVVMKQETEHDDGEDK